MIEAARANTNATFDFVTSLMTVKFSLRDGRAFQPRHSRKQFESLTAQSKEACHDRAEVATDRPTSRLKEKLSARSSRRVA